MKRKLKIFACLNCGRDTGCVNHLVCPRCRKSPNNIKTKMKPNRSQTVRSR